mmetsp:Transcript_10968/g.30768  ORF Transcript_10968/g.30768 Transcript_10968/m.30768 type:complete len:205 (-) Transcript_10968:279-893(-)
MHRGGMDVIFLIATRLQEIAQCLAAKLAHEKRLVVFVSYPVRDKSGGKRSHLWHVGEWFVLFDDISHKRIGWNGWRIIGYRREQVPGRGLLAFPKQVCRSSDVRCDRRRFAIFVRTCCRRITTLYFHHGSELLPLHWVVHHCDDFLHALLAILFQHTPSHVWTITRRRRLWCFSLRLIVFFDFHSVLLVPHGFKDLLRCRILRP